MSDRLDRHLSDLDYQIGAAHGRVEMAYALDQHEARKEAAFRRLEALIQERDALRRAWSSADRDEPQEGSEHTEPRKRALFGPGVEEIPIYDPEALIW